MLILKKNLEDFYNEIREQFPRMKQLGIWDTCNWSLNSDEHLVIISKLSEEIANWVAEGQTAEAQKLMNRIEHYFHEGDAVVTSYLYTDFLVTIMEAKKEIREAIKDMMGPETQLQYQDLFKFYRELDT